MKSVSANTGFSLYELMVVVAIIAIISTIAVPNFLNAQARAKRVVYGFGFQKNLKLYGVMNF